MSGDIIIGSTEENAKDITTAKTIGDTLEKHYPLYGWCVHADSNTGLIKFWSIRLSGKFGVIIKYPEFENDPSLKRIIQLGGEMLERFRVTRGRANGDHLDGMKQIAGEYGFDYHDMKNAKVTDAIRMRWDHFGKK